MIHSPDDETFDEARDKAKKTFLDLTHDIVNLGPEWVEENFPSPLNKNPWRHWLGKGIALAFVAAFVVVNWGIGAMIYGYWDK